MASAVAKTMADKMADKTAGTASFAHWTTDFCRGVEQLQTKPGNGCYLARRSRNQSNGVETQSAQRFGSRSQRNASASVTSFELRALCDEKSCSENKILQMCNTEVEPERTEECLFALFRVIGGKVIPLLPPLPPVKYNCVFCAYGLLGASILRVGR